jgi:hypothetical protein
VFNLKQTFLDYLQQYLRRKVAYGDHRMAKTWQPLALRNGVFARFANRTIRVEENLWFQAYLQEM